MHPDLRVTFKDEEERQDPFLEIINAEKNLWSLIHSKGLLHGEVQELYRKARSAFEKIILDDHEEVELQDVEYSLWKLHYKHIDEFRKIIRQTSVNAGNTKSPTPQNIANVQSIIDDQMEQFKLFLSEATEFYHDLIKKLRKSYGLPEDPLFYENGVSCTVNTEKFNKCQYSCHRFLVCLGDLARYRELFKKPNFQKCNWSIAATYYFKAKLVWPDSGNPQNQLALLATYIGDEFLALYHCIRSLAIKEPFPDASDNLILLFEKNRSSHLHSLSKEAHFNFMNPSERSISVTGLPARNGSKNNDTLQTSEHVSSTRSELWPLFVRMISFFFIEFSLEDFNYTLASTMKELETLLDLDDMKLRSSLESYQLLDPGRTGPYRALQMVSVLIFIIDSLTKSLDLDNNEGKEKNKGQQPTLIQSALISSFIFLGRLVERSLKNDSVLLTAVLIFIEWLVDFLTKVETYSAHEEVGFAVSYFFNVFVDLLNDICKNEDEIKVQDSTALWEDHELRGFTPISHTHELLIFSTDPEPMKDVDCRSSSRTFRIFHSAMKIMEISGDHQKWIFYDKFERRFYREELTGVLNPSAKELHQDVCETTAEDKSHPSDDGKVVAEEEEEIVFKPILRYNSAPPSTFLTNDEMPMEDTKDQKYPSSECLRRATSLLAGQSPTQIDPLSLYSDSNFRNNKPLKDPTLYPAGPPSLSGWVLNRDSTSTEKEKGTRDFYKPGLDPIAEMVSPSLAGLSICESKESVIGSGSSLGSGHISSTIPYPPPPYSGPVPSAPLLPDDAVWFTGNSASVLPEYGNMRNTKETDGILGASPAAHGPLSYGPGIPGLNEGYQPVIGMSSSEWLHQYTSQNLERASSRAWPVHFYESGNPGNIYGPDVTTFDLCDRWGNPLASNQMVYLEGPQLYPGPPLIYGSDEQRREKLFHNYPRPSPYGCGAVTELRADQPPLLQYLKEREWQFQKQSQVRGPSYMGN